MPSDAASASEPGGVEPRRGPDPSVPDLHHGGTGDRGLVSSVRGAAPTSDGGGASRAMADEVRGKGRVPSVRGARRNPRCRADGGLRGVRRLARLARGNRGHGLDGLPLDGGRLGASAARSRRSQRPAVAPPDAARRPRRSASLLLVAVREPSVGPHSVRGSVAGRSPPSGRGRPGAHARCPRRRGASGPLDLPSHERQAVVRVLARLVDAVRGAGSGGAHLLLDADGARLFAWDRHSTGGPIRQSPVSTPDERSHHGLDLHQPLAFGHQDLLDLQGHRRSRQPEPTRHPGRQVLQLQRPGGGL